MKIYAVGGSVRDMLLGLEPKDRDYVVVGSSEEEMLSLGYKKVGADFPVFLHPETGEEYALARKEKKSGSGYNGFVCETEDVTLEEDLARRDIAINSIAYDLETGQYIDPHGGIADLEARTIRHTSSAFSDDPLRVLRVARFAARYQFHVSGDTWKLCQRIVSSGEMFALSNERIWLEIEKIFDEKYPSIAMNFLIGMDIWKVPKVAKYLNLNYRLERFHEERFSKIEKMFYMLSILKLTRYDALEMRIPINIYKKLKFFDEYALFLTIKKDAETIINFHNIYKYSISEGFCQEFRHMMQKKPTGLLFFNVVDRSIECEACFHEISSLEYDEVACIPKQEIPEYVRSKKIAAVENFLKTM